MMARLIIRSSLYVCVIFVRLLLPSEAIIRQSKPFHLHFRQNFSS
jgi:hypothetical protein